jgi:hypothetical protein
LRINFLRLKVYLAASENESYAGELVKAGFKEITTSPFMWRDNALNLVSAKLFSREGQAGETIHLSLGRLNS